MTDEGAVNKLPKKMIALLAGLILVFVGFNSFLFTVREDRQVVVTRFGKPVRVLRDAGLHYRVPFIEQLSFFDRRLLEYDSNPTEIITQDKKSLVVDNFSRWRIVDPLQFLRTVRNETGAQARIDDIIYSELRLELGRKDLIDIVAKERAQLMENVTKASDEKAREYGIQIVDVRLKRADLPAENLKAIYGRMQAERQRIARQYRSEGKEQAEKIRAETNRERDVLLAEAYEQEQTIMGEGDAQSIDINARAFGQDEEFYAFLKSLEVYQRSFKDKTTLVLPANSDFLRFLQGSQGKDVTQADKGAGGQAEKEAGKEAAKQEKKQAGKQSEAKR